MSSNVQARPDQRTDISKLVVHFSKAAEASTPGAVEREAEEPANLKSCETVREERQRHETPLPTSKPIGQKQSNPLRRFSLLDSADELERLAQVQTPLLGQFCLKGQSTVIYAKPNTGKTLICMSELPAAVSDGRFVGSNIYYVDADDTPTGVLEKITLLRPSGIHVLAPGFKGFEAKHFASLLQQMVDQDTAKDSFVITDTLKKFVSLMDKRESSGFAEFVRRFVMRGGSFLGLATQTSGRTGMGSPSSQARATSWMTSIVRTQSSKSEAVRASAIGSSSSTVSRAVATSLSR